MKDRIYNHQITFLITVIVASAIMAESIGMLILHYTGTPHNDLVVLDSFLVVLFLLPVLHILVFRPMLSQREHMNGAVEQIKPLSGLLSICASCKKIREEDGNWTSIESYLVRHAPVSFTHSICAGCIEKHYPDLHEEPAVSNLKEQ